MNNLHINNSNYIGNTSNYLINYTNKTITSNIRYTSNYIDNNFKITSNYIDNNIMYTSNYIDNNITNTSNYIKYGNNNINNNLNKYFTFSDIPNDNSFYDFFLSRNTSSEVARLNLIKETTASSGLRVNTSIENDNYLQICNTRGDNCYKLFVDGDNSLVAQYGNSINTKKQLAKPIADVITPTISPTLPAVEPAVAPAVEPAVEPAVASAENQQ